MMRPLAPNSPWRDGKLLQVNAAYEAFLRQGFPTADFEGQPEPEALQCRDATDQIRWLGLLLKCQAVIAQGGGDLPIDPPIRCLSNREYVVSYSDAAARMLVLMDQFGEALKNSWRLKDEVNSASSRTALSEIDLEAGWLS